MNSYGFYGDWTRIFMGEIVSRSSSETPWRPGKLSLGQLLMPQVCHDGLSTNCVAKNIFEKFMTFKIYGEIDVYQFIPFTLSSRNPWVFRGRSALNERKTHTIGDTPPIFLRKKPMIMGGVPGSIHLAVFNWEVGTVISAATPRCALPSALMGW